MKVLVLGATGLLGVPLSNFLKREGFYVIRHGFSKDADYQIDMRIFSDAKKMLEKVNPDFIINLVALTDVDKCEKNPNLAYQLNVRTVENIISCVIEDMNKKIIHISTDQVYDGNGPHKENNITIRNYYAFSKLCAEYVVLRGNSCILRTNFVGKSQVEKWSFSDWVVENLKKGNPIKLFTDIKFSPISINTLCNMIKEVINHFKVGIFNLGSWNGMSKRDFAVLLANKLNLNLVNCEDVVSKDIKLIAQRPTDMRMDSSLFERTFNVKLPDLIDEIERIGKEYENKD